MKFNSAFKGLNAS